MGNTGKDANNHPKPTEEVQMNIETVIPDTENIVPPSVRNEEPATANKTEEAQMNIETVTPDTENIAPPFVRNEEHAAPTQTEEPGQSQSAPKGESTANEETKTDDSDDDGDDARDQIETVSP
ncbi:hypothetical protein [Pedobacter sp.]|uniref:hypothetical protein n=1 Tax=Pedobacter sp. TaxID=1411316 RepID=UPI003D7FD9B3